MTDGVTSFPSTIYNGSFPLPAYPSTVIPLAEEVFSSLSSSSLNITGTVLCILAAVPLFAAMCVSASGLFYIGAVCLLLAIVSVGCFAFVLGGVNHSAMQALLEEEDYTRENKAKSPVVGAVSGIYWLLVTAVYLFYTFGPMGNGQPKYSWFIWAVAGVLFGAVMLVVKLIARRK